MENLRDNNYGYELPFAILEIIEECEEDEDEEKLEILDKILDLCDHTDLEILSQENTIDNLISKYEELRDDEDVLLSMLVKKAQRGIIY